MAGLSLCLDYQCSFRCEVLFDIELYNRARGVLPSAFPMRILIFSMKVRLLSAFQYLLFSLFFLIEEAITRKILIFCEIYACYSIGNAVL